MVFIGLIRRCLPVLIADIRNGISNTCNHRITRV
jgi:hypothetical protein